MAKKPTTSLAESKNSMVEELRSHNWLYNPVVYSQISGDFTLMQQRLLIGIVEKLQKKIIDSVAEQHKSKTFPDIFSESELMNRDTITIDIPMQDLGLQPKHYDQLAEAAEGLAKLTMKYPVFDSSGKVRKYVVASLFPRIEIPTSLTEQSRALLAANPDISEDDLKKRRKGIISVKMLTENLRDVFTMQYGYVTHLSHVAIVSNKKRTPRLYIYLSRYRDIGHKQVPYRDLIEYLGLTDEYYNESNSGENPFSSWAKVKQLVLEPVRKEIEELAKQGEIDFYFEYSPIYPKGKTRGLPEFVEFQIHKTKLGLDRDINNERIMQERTICSTVIDMYPSLSFRVIGQLCADLSDTDLPEFGQFITDTLPRLMAGRTTVRNPAGYAMTLMQKWHDERIRSRTSEPVLFNPDNTTDIAPVTIPGDRVGEWQQILSLAAPELKELLAAATYLGTTDGIMTFAVSDIPTRSRIESLIAEQPDIIKVFRSVSGTQFGPYMQTVIQ